MEYTWSVAEAAAVLGKPESFVKGLIASGELPVLHRLTFTEFTVDFVSRQRILALLERGQRMRRVTGP